MAPRGPLRKAASFPHEYPTSAPIHLQAIIGQLGGQAMHHAHIALKFSARHADESSGPHVAQSD